MSKESKNNDLIQLFFRVSLCAHSWEFQGTSAVLLTQEPAFWQNSTWTFLTMSLLPFWALNISVAFLSMQGQNESSRISLNIPLFVFRRWTKVLWVWDMSRVGYRNPVPIWHRFLYNRYVLKPNQIADFGASFRCHAWTIGWNICPLFLQNGRKKHHHRTWKIISRLRKCTWTQFGKLIIHVQQIKVFTFRLKSTTREMRASEWMQKLHLLW